MTLNLVPRVAFVVNGDARSAMAERAQSFAARLDGQFDCRVVYRTGGKVGAAVRMLRGLFATRPDVCYVLDLAASGVTAAGLYKQATGTPFVLDFGDAVVELGRALGRGRVASAATRTLQAYALRQAAAVVVRGSFHRELLAEQGIRADFIPDGVDVDAFAQPPPSAKRKDDPLVIGLIGSSDWVPGRQTCYGWELVELIRLLKGRLPFPVRGVLIGDGTGVHILKQRCREYGILDQVDFVGRVPYAELPARLRMMDICLSTQTNDVIGQVRTTGKLPLYLAAGRFVLASRVGEAARILPREMLVDFAGESDPDYPAKLADRILELIARGVDFAFRPECVGLAGAHFHYDLLADRVRDVLQLTLASNAAALPTTAGTASASSISPPSDNSWPV